MRHLCHEKRNKRKLCYVSRSSLWVQALGSTLAISLFPFIILFFFTLDNSPEQQGVLKVLLR